MSPPLYRVEALAGVRGEPLIAEIHSPRFNPARAAGEEGNT